ncbi:heavy metal translocating P-type ATPase [Clostridium paraputrificum]|uniref:heavy metal translocating P-type ATPase n=1 Tax=Clostridium TaxID=1485 RepID=UPI000C082292|nr:MULTISPECIES: heavy metal translocating P-type ATPase [Clostridium]MBS7130409.1 cadmium-translocating P-type ATPase [Clostridium sp.]MDB2075846.1 heavy metal translocating P-type ATPase [Clostridium paraputrificum]MDB2078790.1 heavy metal translocating P-type ATPase [Clostridium paraputrificum]MDB2086572.1 heavy metal translocating P-type ATPase [Clostridium paraputrificum]MDB2092548.1 heavy metal translocating P-type ATPase [Clostridium paraputrificum]
MTNEIKLYLKGLDCANCANKIENKVNKLESVEEAVLNFSLSLLIVNLKENSDVNKVEEEIKTIVNNLEPDVIVSKYDNNIKEKKNVCTSECCSGHAHNVEEKHEESHEHNHSEGVSLRDKVTLAIGFILFAIAIFIGEEKSYVPYIYALSYVLVGGKVVLSAIRNIFRGQVFDENFLMTVATLGAFAIGNHPEGVAVMIFYEIGELFQSYAVNRSRKSISSLMDIRADYANLIIDGKEKKVDPSEIKIDDIIVIKPGERVPLDGVVIEGNSSLDTSALTGESLPRNIELNDEILAGVINLTGVIRVKVTKEFGESTVSRILELVQNASSKKAQTEKFITKFARYYTPVVVLSAVALAIIPPLVVEGALFSDWVYRALIFLVVSCPCALVVSIPLGLFAGIGGASKNGVLIKGGNYLEALKDVETVVFDKTGTLTKGVFKVVKINTNNIEEGELLRIAATGESFSNHPIAQSILKAYGKEVDKSIISNYEEISGNGIKVNIDNKEVLLGNYKLMNSNGIKYTNSQEIGTVVHVVVDGEYKGNIVIADEVKEDSKEAIEMLKKIGVKKCVMLTGDNKKVAEKIAEELGLDEVYAELLPTDKVAMVEKLLKEKSEKGKLAFVGDGINDAPVLARADVGVAMGGIGSDAAIEAADVVLMRDNPSSLVDAIEIGRKTNRILWQNIIFSLGVKIAVLIPAAIGIANMWEGVFADVGVTLIAVLNSMRALRK